MKMKNKIDKCVVRYEPWQMQCCGEELVVGKVAELFCIKRERYKNYIGIDIDYDEEHHCGGANCRLRGIVTRIQSIFVDKFARIEDKNRHIDDPNNEFAIIDTHFIDGYEQCDNYGNRKAYDVVDYIVTLENVVERQYEDDPGCSSRGKYINIEPGNDGKELFVDEADKLIGDTDSVSFYEGTSKQTIDLTQFLWHEEIVTWNNDFQNHIVSGNSVWSNDEWLDWWCRGYCWAKRLREILPSDVKLNYGDKAQTQQVIRGCKGHFELNPGSCRVSICENMDLKSKEGLYVSSCFLDWGYDEDTNQNYRFWVENSNHHLFPGDRVMLCVCGRPAYQIGTVLSVDEHGIIIHTDRWLDISEEYSIELID